MSQLLSKCRYKAALAAKHIVPLTANVSEYDLRWNKDDNLVLSRFSVNLPPVPAWLAPDLTEHQCVRDFLKTRPIKWNISRCGTFQFGPRYVLLDESKPQLHIISFSEKYILNNGEEGEHKGQGEEG